MSPRARSCLRAAVLTLVLVPFLAGAAGGGASGASVLPGAPADRVAAGPAVAQRAAPGWEQGKIDPRHPFSDPIYYPLRQYMRMDCFKGNPGCPGYHKVWTLTLSSVAAQIGPGDNAIVAMGAGRYQFVRKGPECGRGGSAANFGTEVLIDHGGGVVTRYGHLSNRDLARYRAKDGRLVAAGERIGTMGMTGARRCGKPYVNFHIERQGTLTRFDSLTACLDRVRQQWPRDQFSGYRTWNQVPEDDMMKDRGVPSQNRSFFPRMKSDEKQGSLDPANAPDSTCLPTAAPATPNRPVKPAVAQAGKGKLRVTWRGQPARTYAVARVLYLRRSDNTWRLATTRVARRGTQAVVIGGLRSGVRHRVTLSYRNGVGFSAYSPASDRFTT